MEKSVNIVLLGCGTVGTQVARLLQEQADLLAARVGARLELTKIVVKDLNIPRDAVIDTQLLTTDISGLFADTDIVIELIGGIEPARSYVRQALMAGCAVVTGNKALLATHGAELYELARQYDVELYYEAAVAGAVPIVRGIRESLAGDKINSVLGIMNGTTNFILDEMTTKGMDFAQALKLAQDLGYAEADPTADVEGLDAGAKIAILASLAFHARVGLADVAVEGISNISATDIAMAQKAGYVIKLIATARRYELQRDGKAGISVAVSPTLVAKANPLAQVTGSFNSVMVEAEAADRLVFSGRGAGGAPTASAVLSDVVAVARKRVAGDCAAQEIIYGNLPILPASEFISSYFIKVLTLDTTDITTQITTVFTDNEVALATVKTGRDGVCEANEIVFITSPTSKANLDRVLACLQEVPEVVEIIKVMKVEGK